MPGPADLACALLTAPLMALVALLSGVLALVLGGEPLADAAMFGGLAAFLAMPPASIVLRARIRRLSVDWTCLLFCLTLLSMVATLVAIATAVSFAYAWFMRDF